MHIDSFVFFSRIPKTGSIIGDMKNLQEKYIFYDCKLKDYPQLFFEDNENVLGE